MRSKNRQLLPASNDSYVQVPGRQGSVLFPRELQDRYIDLDCAFIEKNFPDIRIRAREIAAWLYTEGREILSFNDEPDRYYRGKITSQVDFEHMATMGQFSLTFRCEPLAYGGEEIVDFVDDVAIVYNQGTYESLPVFKATFTHSATEWKVTGPGGSYIRVVHGFKNGDTLEIDCLTGAILLNATRALDKLDWQNSRFFSLRVGENNLGIEPTEKCTAQISWIPRCL